MIITKMSKWHKEGMNEDPMRNLGCFPRAEGQGGW